MPSKPPKPPRTAGAQSKRPPFDVAAEREKAIRRASDLIDAATKAADYKSAAAAVRELSRLVGGPPASVAQGTDDGADSDALRRLDLIESYLLPLNLCDADLPVEEHVRVAAELLRQNGLAKFGSAPQS